MNDRTRKIVASLAGTLGHFAFTALGNRLMQVQKRRSFGLPGGLRVRFR